MVASAANHRTLTAVSHRDREERVACDVIVATSSETASSMREA